MKFTAFVFDKYKIILIIVLICSFIILLFSFVKFIKLQNKDDTEVKVQTIKTENKLSTVNAKELAVQFENKINFNSIEVQEYSIMPQYVQNFLVIGELQIPSIGLDTYILNETSEKSLNVSVTKLEGPKINQVGNFCITGHNYFKDNMFGKLKKVNIGDTINLIDTFGKIKQYEVYDKYEINPDDISVLKQDTKGKVEVTLITCTTGAKKRVVVKAREIK